MAQGCFITGTDTDIGKTYVTLSIMQVLKQKGYQVAGLKPIATGCVQGKNNDALALQKQSSVNLPYHFVNPYGFQAAIAPNIAIEQAGVMINFSEILDNYEIVQQQVDYVLVEGIGGWLVPLNQRQSVADLAFAFNLPVILVVGMRLGCLNHALLSSCCMLQQQVSVLGWIANQIDPQMLALVENIKTLKRQLPIPLLGIIGYQANTLQYTEEFAKYFDIYIP